MHGGARADAAWPRDGAGRFPKLCVDDGAGTRTALGEEAAIARALTLETAEGNVGRSAASTLQTRYGSNELTIYLLQNGETITGEALPTVQKLPELLNTETRATLLDGVSERLLIAHALDGEITLLTALDVSPVYALRRELLRGAAALGLIGLALAGALAIWISGVLTRPLSQLADAAAKLADGDYAAPLPATKNDEMNALIRAFSRMSAAIDERETALRTQAEERQALIDALAHEMRTPLTAILGGARLLQQSRLSGSQQSELLDTMAREASRLSTMDERLLLLTRLDHEAPAFAPFDSQAMAREALSVYGRRALGRGWRGIRRRAGTDDSAAAQSGGQCAEGGRKRGRPRDAASRRI